MCAAWREGGDEVSKERIRVASYYVDSGFDVLEMGSRCRAQQISILLSDGSATLWKTAGGQE